MRDEPSVIDLVVRARAGDQAAWDAIVERFAPLVWGVCRRHGLSGSDIDDVGGSVWLRLVENLDRIREPAALPGWLATTARNECLLMLRGRKRQTPVGDPELGGSVDDVAGEDLLVAERNDALRNAFATLPERCRRLLAMLFEDPMPPYAEISSTLNIPVGSIGPNRQRCLSRLRRSPVMTAFEPA